MKEFYIKTSTWHSNNPIIVDEESMYQAERGINDLNPNEFTFLCEAECIADAKEFIKMLDK